MADLLAGALSRAWKGFRSRCSRRDLLGAAIGAVAFLLYFGVRGAVIDRPETAYRHALDIIDAQRALGFFWEDDLNSWVKDKLFVAQAMNLVYFYLHFPLIIVFGIWLYYFRREKYTLTRDAFLASGYDTQSTRAFVNPYAAMPSLHFGWDLLLGLGIIWAFWPPKRASGTNASQRA